VTVTICDVCLRQPVGRVEAYRAVDRVFHVCAQREDKPWRVPPAMTATVTLTPSATPAVRVFVAREEAPTT
jgi:hypothetical protein